MRFLYLLFLITYSTSIFLSNKHKHQHPNSMKHTIDYTKSGMNWPGVCRSGVKQSPIAIDKSDRIDKDILDINYGKSGGNFEWNGSFFKIDIKDNMSKVKFLDTIHTPHNQIEYVLKRVIFRTPPEHIIEGRLHDVEIQLIHETSDKKQINNLLIISIFGQITNNKKLIDDWWNGIVFDSKARSSLEGTEKILDMLKDYFHYEGSQTVPNCVENVHWIIFKKPILMDPRVINSLQRNFCEMEFPHGNARHVQNDNERQVTEYNLKDK